MATDKDRIDWLEKQVSKGACLGLINDDNGHWALSWRGMQNVVTGKKGKDVWTSFHIPAKDWRKTIRKAIDAAMQSEPAGGK